MLKKIEKIIITLVILFFILLVLTQSLLHIFDVVPHWNKYDLYEGVLEREVELEKEKQSLHSY